MAAIAIGDLAVSRTLDRRAMSSIRGGGAPWVYGWIRPYLPASPGIASAGNFYQINNYYADQMINQVQVVNINNTAANANINVALDERGKNSRFS